MGIEGQELRYLEQLEGDRVSGKKTSSWSQDLALQSSLLDSSSDCSWYDYLTNRIFGSKNLYLRTLLRYLQPGRPLSRANDHVIREEDARSPIVEQKVNAMTKDVITVVPRDEPLL